MPTASTVALVVDGEQILEATPRSNLTGSPARLVGEDEALVLVGGENLASTELVRYIGVSNETFCGVMEFVRAAKVAELPKIISIQNSYNLLTICKFEVLEVMIKTSMHLLWCNGLVYSSKFIFVGKQVYQLIAS
ncbi:hypothetical protein V2J09_011243 [Rumex salicifolius]